ncbi:hypothetical protein Tco_1391720 [Tanacetum coccineum]
MRYIERKKDTRKFIIRSIEVGPYKLKEIPATDTVAKTTEKEDDLTGDDLKQYETNIDAMNLILLPIPNDIYNSVDACENANVGYREELCDDQEDSLTTAMMLLARAITQWYFTPTNNRLHTSSNTRDQAVVQADRVDIQSRNVGNGGRNVRRTTDNQGDAVGRDAPPNPLQSPLGILSGRLYKRNAPQNTRCSLFAKKDEVGIILIIEHNDFLLADASEIEEFKDLSAMTHAYGDVRSQNQDLLITFSELKAKLKKIEKGDTDRTVDCLGHNLFSEGQFCDGNLEVAFRSKTCYVRNLEGEDLLTGARDSNLYTISISDMAASSPVCLMSKATSTKSWL